MNQLMYLRSYHRRYETLSASAASRDIAMEQHQTIKRWVRLVDNHASFFRGPGLTFRARNPHPVHPTFLHIL
jgi:hypothetical protein